MSSLIPTQFELLGETYTVEIINPEDKNEYSELVNTKNNQILIPSGLTPDKQGVSFYHSLFTLIFDYLGTCEIKDDKEDDSEQDLNATTTTFTKNRIKLFSDLFYQFEKTKVIGENGIPMFFKLHAITINILYKPYLFIEHGFQGMSVYHPVNEIHLQNNLLRESNFKTFYHELFHFIFDNIKSKPIKPEEVEVDTIANLIHQFEVTKIINSNIIF